MQTLPFYVYNMLLLSTGFIEGWCGLFPYDTRKNVLLLKTQIAMLKQILYSSYMAYWVAQFVEALS